MMHLYGQKPISRNARRQVTCPNFKLRMGSDVFGYGTDTVLRLILILERVWWNRRQVQSPGLTISAKFHRACKHRNLPSTILLHWGNRLCCLCVKYQLNGLSIHLIVILFNLFPKDSLHLVLVLLSYPPIWTISTLINVTCKEQLQFV